MENPDRPEDLTARRRAAHDEVERRLSSLRDEQLAHLLAGATSNSPTTGGSTAALQVGSVQVFVKRVPLTALESRPENRQSTRNLFDLPLHFHYGISSRGFGAWRELSAHVMTSDGVLSGRCPNFPLLHHWRVLRHDSPACPTPEASREIDRLVAYWEGSAAVRARLEAIRDAPADLVLFLEHLPRTLHGWLAEQLAADERTATDAVDRVEHELLQVTSALREQGLIHFDAHFQNLLVDGGRLFLSDFGLAISDRFELTAHETAFLERHRDFDRGYAMTRLVDFVVDAAYGAASRDAVLRDVAAGSAARPLPRSIARVVTRHAPLAIVMNGFYRLLARHAKTTPFPAAEVRRASLAAGLD